MDGQFNVIIVGGGPVGLTAAHALHHAGIDFIILERRDSVIVDEGASLVLGPQNLRVMHQFGLLERLLAISAQVQRNRALTTQSKIFRDTTSPQWIQKNHGMGFSIFHRAELIQALYDGLPAAAKERYHTSKNVEDIGSSASSVTVTCSDGSTYTGSLVIGADGVNSKTRRVMRNLALAANPASNKDWDPEFPFLATYKCMWCSFPRLSERGETYETQSKGRSTMYMSGQERGWIFAYERLPEPTSERVSYTTEHLEEYAESFAEFPVTEKMKLKEVYAKRTSAGMGNLGEGIARHWSWGRIVLAGDACHKFTPNAGLGLNGGIQDVVVLCNGLRRLVQTNAQGEGTVDTAALGQVFTGYRRVRIDEINQELKQSAMLTRMHASANAGYFALERYITNPVVIQQLLIRTVVASAVKVGHVLDYVPTEEPFKGRVEWVHPLG